MNQIIYASKQDNYQFIPRKNLHSLERFFENVMDLCNHANSENANDSFIFWCEKYRNANYLTLSASRDGRDISTGRTAPYSHIYFEDIDSGSIKEKIKNEGYIGLFDRDFINQELLNQIVQDEIAEEDIDKLEIYTLKGVEREYSIADEILAIILSFIYSERRIYIQLSSDEQFKENARLLLKKIYENIPYALRLKTGCAVGFSPDEALKERIKLIIGTDIGSRFCVRITNEGFEANDNAKNELDKLPIGIDFVQQIINDNSLRNELFDEYDYYVSSKEDALNGYSKDSFKQFFNNVITKDGNSLSHYYESFSFLDKEIKGEVYEYKIYSFNIKQSGLIYEIAKESYFNSYCKRVNGRLSNANHLNDLINHEGMQVLSYFVSDSLTESQARELFSPSKITQILNKTIAEESKKNTLGTYGKYDLRKLLDNYNNDSIMHYFIYLFHVLLSIAASPSISKPNLIIADTEKAVKEKLESFFFSSSHDFWNDYGNRVANLREYIKAMFVQAINQVLKVKYNDIAYYECINESFNKNFDIWFLNIREVNEKRLVSQYVASKLEVLEKLGPAEIKEIAQTYNECIREKINDCNKIKLLYSNLIAIRNKNEDNRTQIERLEVEIEKNKEDIKLYTTQLKELKSEKSILINEKSGYITEVSVLKSEIDSLEIANESLEKQNGDLKDEFEVLKRDFDELISSNKPKHEEVTGDYGKGSNKGNKKRIEKNPIFATATIKGFVVCAVGIFVILLVFLTMHFFMLSRNGNTSPSINAFDVPDGVSGNLYSFYFEAIGEPRPTWTHEGGPLPYGLSLSEWGGLIGVPEETGYFTFYVRATNSEGSERRRVTLDILPGQDSPIIEGPVMAPNGIINSHYSFQLEISGSPAPNYNMHGELPPGLTIIDGLISGVPLQAGSFTFEIEAYNTEGVDRRNITIIIEDAEVHNVIRNDAPGGIVGMDYDFNFKSMVHSTHIWDYSGNLPPGLTFTSDGSIKGIPTTAGEFIFIITATDFDYHESCTIVMIISEDIMTSELVSPLIALTQAPNGMINKEYNFQFDAVGSPSIVWTSQGRLPFGLTLNEQGLITGVPEAIGTFNFTIIATNTEGEDKQQVMLIITEDIDNDDDDD